MSVYEHLEPGHIRLISIDLPRSNGTTVLSLETSLVSIIEDKRPPYTALSYTWGTEPPTNTIIVNGSQLFVRPNLYHALEHLGKLSVEHQQGDLWWIDSICINQSDDTEKVHQVNMMGDIYRLAYKVLVWLGPEENGSALAMEILQQVGELTHSQRQHQREAEQFLENHPAGPDATTAVSKLFQRAWFCRAWTLQEYVLAEELFFQCGDQGLSRRGFERAIRWINTLATPAVKTKGFRMAWKRKKIRYSFFTTHADGPAPFPLVDLLVYAGGSAATTGRDCIYSLLGLVSDKEALGVSPQYGDGVSEATIFESLARSHVKATNCLDIICFADAMQRQAEVDCPSWVPYWPNHGMSTAGDHMAWQSFRRLAMLDTRFQSWAMFKASGCLQPPPQEAVTEPGVLNCRGISLGTVSRLATRHTRTGGKEPIGKSQPPRRSIRRRRSIGSWQPSVEMKGDYDLSVDLYQALVSDGNRIENDGDVTSSTGISLTRASLEYQPPKNVWKTLVLDRGDLYLRSLAPKVYADDFKFLCKLAILDPRKLHDDIRLWFWANVDILFHDLNNKPDIKENLATTRGTGSRLSPFEEQVLHTWNTMNNILMISDAGDWGMAPTGASPGDQIFILAGCNVPVVVRPCAQNQKEGFLKLVGECYVDGAMEGEHVVSNSDTATWQTVLLT